MSKLRYISLVLTLSVGSSSCWFRKPPVKVFVPPPPRISKPVPREAAEIAPLDTEVEFPVAEIPEYPSSAPPQIPPPPPPKLVVIPAQPKPAIAPVVVSPEPPPPAPPKLAQIFTADQTREYLRTLDESLDRVKRILMAVGAKTLNNEQAEIQARILTFQKQAEQTREQDLVTAVNLARRADLLAQDLLKRLP